MSAGTDWDAQAEVDVECAMEDARDPHRGEEPPEGWEPYVGVHRASVGEVIFADERPF